MTQAAERRSRSPFRFDDQKILANVSFRSWLLYDQIYESEYFLSLFSLASLTPFRTPFKSREFKELKFEVHDGPLSATFGTLKLRRSSAAGV